MARQGYITVAIPSELMDEVDQVIDAKKKGYASRGEFVKDAIRQLIEKIR